MKHLRWMSLILLFFVAAGCSRDPQVLKRKYLEQGNKYFGNGKFKEASLLYRKALQADALFGEGYYRLALSELKLGRYVDAVRSLRRTVELQPENQDAAAKLADIYLAAAVYDSRRNQNLIPELKDLAGRLIKRDPKSYQGLRINGYLALQEKDLKGAIASFRAANDVKPLQPDLVLVLAQSLAADNQAAESEKLLKELLAKEKAYGPAYDVLYLTYAREKRIQEAEQVLQTKVANNPKQGGYRIQLAAHYLALQNRSKMLEVIKELTSNTKDFPTAYLLAGDFFFRIREYDLARQQYDSGMKAFAKDRQTYQKRVIETLVAQNRPAEALQLAEAILKDDPKDTEAIAMRASLWLTVGKREQVQAAITDLQSVVTKMPDNPVLRFNLSRALLAKGDLEASRVQLREAIKLRGDYLPPKFTLAQIHLAKQEFPQALQLANEIQAISPANLQAKLIRASALMGMNSNDQARQEIQATLKEMPTSRDAQFQLGMLNFREKKYGDAEPIFRKLHEMTPPDPRGLPGIVEISIATGKLDAAMDLLRKELVKRPDRSELHLMLGNTAARAEKYDMAIDAYKQVLAKNPAAGDVYYRLGEVCRAKNDWSCAEAQFAKSRELMPNDPRPPLQIAMLFDLSGRRDQARPMYDQVLKLQPDNPLALNNLAYILAEEGRDLDTALTMAEKAKQKAPQNLDIADTLGWIYIKKNLADNAARIFADIVTKQPANPSYRYHYAMALFQRGDKPQAKRELEAALRNKPSKQDEAKIRELMAKIG